MAKLIIDTAAFWACDALHRGNRERALSIIGAAVESGNASLEILALAEFLRTARRGRQPFGAKHLWYEIGSDNEEMRDSGMAGAARYNALALLYRINDHSKLKTAIAKFERTMAVVRAIDEDERRR